MKFTKITKILTFMFLICFLMVSPAAAGDGDGSGGGSGNPLTLVSSSPASGEEDVPINSTILLEFSKNVVNMSVKDNNAACFSLYQGESLIAVNVVMADDQMEPDKKRQIIVVPVEPLQPGTLYTLKISPEVTSKSGVSLGEQVQISFTTAGAVAETSQPAEVTVQEPEKNDSPELTTPAAEEADESDITAPEEESDVTESTSQSQKSEAEDDTDEDTADESGHTNPWFFVGAAVLIAAIVFGMIRYRKK